MDFICIKCGKELTAEDVARQFRVGAIEAGVVSHEGPFEYKPEVQTRPENVPTR